MLRLPGDGIVRLGIILPADSRSRDRRARLRPGLGSSGTAVNFPGNEGYGSLWHEILAHLHLRQRGSYGTYAGVPQTTAVSTGQRTTRCFLA